MGLTISYKYIVSIILKNASQTLFNSHNLTRGPCRMTGRISHISNHPLCLATIGTEFLHEPFNEEFCPRGSHMSAVSWLASTQGSPLLHLMTRSHVWYQPLPGHLLNQMTMSPGCDITLSFFRVEDQICGTGHLGGSRRHKNSQSHSFLWDTHSQIDYGACKRM